ncbi:MAG: protein kinase [Planctomycetes bacterium]|nr:protein kinase [Planctomycetota bacterium]
MPANPVLPQQFGRYRILDKLGEGGMGTVYLAEDVQLGRRVALKIPHFDPIQDSEQLKRFYREARTAARIDHPNICPVFDVGEIDGVHYLTMPFIDGTPLSQLAASGDPWQPRQAAELVCQLAEAVQALHQQGLVHRDLKPSNVMVRLEGEPVLMDFGLAKPIQAPDQNLTAAGAMMGTPGYMSPEQVIDARHIGPGMDIYSLGVILYELITGRRPFEGPVAAVYAQILHSAPSPPSSVVPGLDQQLDVICLTALAKKPEERFPTARALADALTRYLGEQTVPAGPFPPPPPAALRVAQVDVRLTCPNCGKHLRIPAALQGKRLKCPRCQMRLAGPTDPLRPPGITTAGTANAGTTTAPAPPTAPPTPGDTVGEPERRAPLSQPMPVVPLPSRGSPVLLAVGVGILVTVLVWALILYLNR